ncbi:MAG: alpha/beta fold hydrolase [Deltaproteobacteria bacterium]|nr:alpha/beta fold hydrolase [Deltaproteobacteria bacterium]
MLSQVRRRKLALPDTAIEIALLDWGGEGPLALLHHANGFCAGAWGPVAELLSDHYRVVAMDARGHGDSSKPEGADCYRWELFGRDVLAVAELLAAEHPDGRIALGLGHSFGGIAILMASAERTDGTSGRTQQRARRRSPQPPPHLAHSRGGPCEVVGEEALRGLGSEGLGSLPRRGPRRSARRPGRTQMQRRDRGRNLRSHRIVRSLVIRRSGANADADRVGGSQHVSARNLRATRSAHGRRAGL